MGSSRALLLLAGLSPPKPHCPFISTKISFASHLHNIRKCSTKATNESSLPPPDVSRLAETARISLSPQQAKEFGPKIRQMIDWFGQLRAVDLNGVEPAIRGDTEGDNLRADIPDTFEKREAIIAAIPSYDEPYIKVPQVLNK